ncbi:hypothetical protein KY334_06790, partial [Candidatus Woesearchaeota archaeon]|nr:hypothetical protein [Candidatus Woesearchaeota archaeon]
PIDYQQQMQFQMFVWKREWNDFVSFDPRVEPPYDLYIKRYMRDPKFDSARILRLADFMREKMEELLNNCQYQVSV